MDKVIYYDVSLDDSASYDVQVSNSESFDTTMNSEVRIVGGGSYSTLKDKPKIEGVVLDGDKSFRDLGLNDITPQDIDEIIFGGG